MNGKEVSTVISHIDKTFKAFKEDAFQPLCKEVKGIAEEQIEQGKQIVALQEQVKSKGNCADHQTLIDANRGNIKTNTDRLKTFGTRMWVLACGIPTILFGVVGLIIRFYPKG
jgi:hypothetical protein